MRNLQSMMGQVKKMQEQLQKQMEALRVEASAGGGIVHAKMNGQKQLLEVRIDPEAVKDADVEMLQDLIVAAVNECARRVDEELQSQLGGMAGGLNMPGMF